MRLWGKQFFGSSPSCPLCGGAKTYRVYDVVDYQGLIQTLNGFEQWKRAHGLGSGIPQVPANFASQIRLPGFKQSRVDDDFSNVDEHKRCGRCHSLLPPEFWLSDDVVANNFALTVAGHPQTGKTTWLISMLTPPEKDTFELIRRTESFQSVSYDYPEPFTLQVLQHMQTRSNIPYVLFGTTVRYHEQIYFVRTLDIMGEQFVSQQPATRQVIQRHLTLKEGRGALLVVDKFESSIGNAGPPAIATIARVYEEIRGKIGRSDGGAPADWSGVIWTHADKAQWTSDSESWLKSNLGQTAAVFVALAKHSSGSPDPLDQAWLASSDAIDDAAAWALAACLLNAAAIGTKAYQEIQAVGSATRVVQAPGPKAVEGLIGLMFRLQMLYCIKALRRREGKLEYLFERGESFVNAILARARALYVLWDLPRGGLNQIVKSSNNFKVLPCGLAGGRTVWSDLILLQTIQAVRSSSS